jgi:hypothetical protein
VCLRDWLKEKLDAYRRRHPDIVTRVFAPAWVYVSGMPHPTVLQPDLAAYQDFPHDRPLAQRRWRDVRPILVADVYLGDALDRDLVSNLALYLQVASLREYWVLESVSDNPDEIILRCFSRRGKRGRHWQIPGVVGSGGLHTTSLLPDFELVVDPHR